MVALINCVKIDHFDQLLTFPFPFPLHSFIFLSIPLVLFSFPPSITLSFPPSLHPYPYPSPSLLLSFPPSHCAFLPTSVPSSNATTLQVFKPPCLCHLSAENYETSLRIC